MESLLEISDHKPAETTELPIAPQIFGNNSRPDPVLRSLMLDTKREELKSLIAGIAMEVCGYSNREELREEIANRDASSIAKMRRENGYTLVDGKRFDEIDPIKTALVSVFFAKSAKNRDLIVPIIVAHDHPQEFGKQIKKAVYEHFVKEHGATPEELAKSTTVKVLESIYGLRKWIFGTIAMGAIIGLGAVKTPELIDSYHDWQQARAEAKYNKYLEESRDALFVIEKSSHAIRDGLVSTTVLDTTISKSQFAMMLDLLRIGTAGEKQRVLEILDTIGPYMRSMSWRTGENTTYLPVDSSIVELIKSEADSPLRHHAADILHSINSD